MTLISDVLARCARECSIDAVSTWAGTTEEDAVALRDDFLVETVENILDRVDVPPMATQIAIPGSDTYTSGSGYALPSAFRRLQRAKRAVYETAPNNRRCIPVNDDGMWTHLQEVGFSGVDRYFRLNGYDGNWFIDFYQVIPTAGSITVSYVSDNWMADSGGTQGSAFTADTDVLLLPRTLVESGIVWRFRRRNGLEYQDKQAEFEVQMSRLGADRNVRRSIDFSGSTPVRHPWDVPIPDYIPEA